MRNIEATSKPLARLALSSAALALGLGSARPAHADAASCTTLHASAQRELKAGRPKSASEQFMTCGSDETCPDAVRTNCMDRYASVEKLIPTVIFSAVDEHGADISAARVYADDHLLQSELDGRAVTLEPGKHRFRFVVSPGHEATIDVLLREGEKNRIVNAKVVTGTGEAPGRSPAPGQQPASGAEGEARTSRVLPAGFWIASGLTVAALGSFTTFAVLGRQKHTSLADCSPDCPPSRHDDYDAMKRDYLIADISLGAAAVSFGVATWLFLSADKKEVPPSAARQSAPHFAIVPVRSGAAVLLESAAF